MALEDRFFLRSRSPLPARRGFGPSPRRPSPGPWGLLCSQVTFFSYTVGRLRQLASCRHRTRGQRRQDVPRTPVARLGRARSRRTSCTLVIRNHGTPPPCDARRVVPRNGATVIRASHPPARVVRVFSKCSAIAPCPRSRDRSDAQEQAETTSCMRMGPRRERPLMPVAATIGEQARVRRNRRRTFFTSARA